MGTDYQWVPAVKARTHGVTVTSSHFKEWVTTLSFQASPCHQKSLTCGGERKLPLSHKWTLKKNPKTTNPLENQIKLTKIWHKKSQDGDPLWSASQGSKKSNYVM